MVTPLPSPGDEGAPPLLRTLVLAPYPALRAGLRTLLGEVPGIEIVGEVADPAALDGVDVDLLVADLGDEPDDLFDALASTLPAVLLADWPVALDVAQVALAPRALLPRSASDAELRAAVAAVALGLSVVSPEALATLPGRDSPLPHEAGESPLTEREREVLELLALGLPNKQIARRLGISEHTAKFHVGAILSKLGAASRTEAVALAARRGLLAL
ncbi:MAG: response regulator transcription factor [Dehalococcoidia bacterium]|nr:response regulator transcription factor [Dehalococcoidia bacterium]